MHSKKLTGNYGGLQELLRYLHMISLGAGGEGLCRSHVTSGVSSSYIWAHKLFSYVPQPDILKASFCGKNDQNVENLLTASADTWESPLARLAQNSLQTFNRFVLAREHGAKCKAHT